MLRLTSFRLPGVSFRGVSFPGTGLSCRLSCRLSSPRTRYGIARLAVISTVAAVAGLAAFSGSAEAQLPLGGAVGINANTFDYQGAPRVAMRRDGSGWFVWESRNGPTVGDVSIREFSAGGSLATEATCNQFTTDDQLRPLVAANFAGTSLGDDEIVASDSELFSYDIAALPAGRSIVVLHAGTLDGDVFGQLLAANGTIAGLPFPLSATDNGPTSERSAPSVASDALGGFVAVWIDETSQQLFARRFRPDASPIGGNIQVTTTTAFQRVNPQVAMGADGSFVVTWGNELTENADGHILGREFARTGTPVGLAFSIESTVDAYNGGVAMSDGRFMATWSAPDVSSTGVWARLYERRVVFSDGFDGGNLDYW
ncbi:MAG: hypothetical protein ABI639_06425 [Thermoanaerobaculia bacterium]